MIIPELSSMPGTGSRSERGGLSLPGQEEDVGDGYTAVS